MKLLNNDKWKLEEITKRVCVFTTIYYGVTIVITALLYLIGFIGSVIPDELCDSYEHFTEVFVFIYGVFLYPNLLLYVTKIIYFIPIIITMFLISVAFTELVKRKNPRVFIHPLVLSSIITSVVGTGAITHLIERAF